MSRFGYLIPVAVDLPTAACYSKELEKALLNFFPSISPTVVETMILNVAAHWHITTDNDTTFYTLQYRNDLAIADVRRKKDEEKLKSSMI